MKKRNHWKLVLILALLSKVWGQDLSIIEQPSAINIVAKDETATLSFVAEKVGGGVHYQWYQSADGTTATGVKIEGASSSIWTTDMFSNKEVRFYYCVASVGEESVVSDVVAVAYTGLPILYLNTEIPIQDITKEEYVFGKMELIYESGEKFSYTFKKEKDGEKKEGVKGRGNTSWGMPKKGYSIKFDKKQSLFGLPESKKWCIIANYSDKTLLRNKLASVLGNDIFDSEWNPSFISVDVVWNGEYQGNYIFCERNVIGEGRVDIQDISDYTEENIAKNKYVDINEDGVVDLYDGGFIIEIDKRKDAPFWFQTKKEGAFVALKDPDEVSVEIQNHVSNVVQTAENSLYEVNYIDEENGWRKYFDENSVIDWYIVNEVARNRDAKSYSSIYKYFSPKDGKIHFGPLWDFDIGYGNDGENGERIDQGMFTGWYITRGIWISQMITDSLFFRNLRNRWVQKKSQLIEMVTAGLQSLADANAVSAECNFKKWEILGKYVWPNPVGYDERLTYQSEVDYMKDWITERIAWLDNALKNSFIISYKLEGGSLSKTKANPNVFVSEGTSDFSLNNPTKKGYVFAGWSGTGIDGVSQNVTVTDDKKGDREFVANWKRDIAACNIVLSTDELVYSGSPKTLDITIVDGKKNLIENTDYTVSYAANVIVGTATATITGIGEYAGSVQKTFEIIPSVSNYAAIQIIEDEKGKRAVINGNYGETDAVELTGDITVASVEFSRVFSTNESATSTLMLPFDVSTGNLTGVQMVLEFDSVAVCRDQSGNPLTNGVGVCVSALWDANQAQTSAILKANTPYMVMMNNATLGITGGVTLQETNPVVVKDKLDPEGWRFQGTYVYKVWNYDTEEKPGQIRGYAAMEQDGAKIGQYVKFGPGASLKPFRAYLYNPNETPLTPPKNAPKASDGAKLAPIANTVASVEDDAMDVVIVGRDNNGEDHTTVIGRYIPRTGEVRLNGEAKRTFDLKGRRANESVKGMYLRK